MGKKYINNAVAWISKDKNDKPYISFKAERDIKEGESINLFKNNKGDNPKRPDYRSFEVVEDEGTEAQSEPEPKSETVSSVDVADDIPF